MLLAATSTSVGYAGIGDTINLSERCGGAASARSCLSSMPACSSQAGAVRRHAGRSRSRSTSVRPSAATGRLFGLRLEASGCTWARPQRSRWPKRRSLRVCADRARVFSIPAGAPFLPAFADALLAGRIVPGWPAGQDPLSLSDGLILLPTRRAARALTACWPSGQRRPRGAAAPHRAAGRCRRGGGSRPAGARRRRRRLRRRRAAPPRDERRDPPIVLARLILAWAQTSTARC